VLRRELPGHQGGARAALVNASPRARFLILLHRLRLEIMSVIQFTVVVPRHSVVAECPFRRVSECFRFRPRPKAIGRRGLARETGRAPREQARAPPCPRRAWHRCPLRRSRTSGSRVRTRLPRVTDDRNRNTRRARRVVVRPRDLVPPECYAADPETASPRLRSRRRRPEPGEAVRVLHEARAGACEPSSARANARPLVVFAAPRADLTPPPPRARFANAASAPRG